MHSLRIAIALGTIFAVALASGFGVAALRRLEGSDAMGVAFALATGLTGAAAVFILRIVGLGGAGAPAVSLPVGESTQYEEQFSFQEALASHGDIEGALASYEAIIADRPHNPLPRLRAAELHAGPGRDPERAATLFRSVRDMPAAMPRDVLYASNRLVDLYEGALCDPRRAVAELRRIIERYPASPSAAHAQSALSALEARLAKKRGEG